jgi:integrative and conjugative element protein (TIGR02256 family)
VAILIDDRPLELRLTFSRARSGRVQIRGTVLQAMLSFAQLDEDRVESGGLLVGRHIRESDDVIVDVATTPLPGDRQERYRFIRGKRAHQAELDRLWETSNGTWTYLGEWHTHAEPVPRPSSVDRSNWRRILTCDQFSEWLFFVIVGMTDLCIWEGRSGHRELHALPRLS